MVPLAKGCFGANTLWKVSLSEEETTRQNELKMLKERGKDRRGTHSIKVDGPGGKMSEQVRMYHSSGGRPRCSKHARSKRHL